MANKQVNTGLDCCSEGKSPNLKVVKALAKGKNKRSSQAQHPDHSKQIKRLNRVIGQLQGIQRMISEHRYCPDILTQTRAAHAALKKVEASILETHLQQCVHKAMQAPNRADADIKVQELIDLFSKT